MSRVAALWLLTALLWFWLLMFSLTSPIVFDWLQPRLMRWGMARKGIAKCDYCGGRLTYAECRTAKLNDNGADT